MMILVPFLIITILNGFSCVVSKKAFGRNLPLTMMLIVYILYFSQLIGGSFQYGIYILVISAVLGIVAITLSRHAPEFKSTVLSNGFWLFLSVFAIFLFVDFGRHFSRWDEYMHWGKMVKEMLRLDQFYCVEQSALIRHKDYPPFISLFEFFWCSLSGGYSEATVTLAIHVFQLSIAVPFLMEGIDLGSRNLHRLLKGCLFILGYIILILFLDGFESFHTIYADILIGLLFAYSMYLVFSGEAYGDTWGTVTYILSLISILYTKQIGIVFCLISWLYYTVRVLRQNRKSSGMRIVSCALPMAFMGLAYLIWNRLVASCGVIGQFDVNNIDVKLFLSCIRSPGIQRATVKRFIEAIFTRNIITGFSPVTFASSVIIVLVALELLYLNHKATFSKSEKNLLAFLLTCGALGYSAVLIVLYVFCFEETEMVTLNSFSRYMGSYFTGEVILLLAVYFDIAGRKYAEQVSIKKLALIVSAAFIFLTPANMIKMIPQVFRGDTATAYEFRTLADHLNRTVEENKKVSVVDTISQQDQDLVYLGYYTEGIRVDVPFMDVLNIDFSQDEESYHQFVEFLKNADYLYIKETSDSFDQYFARFNSHQAFEENALYIISCEEGNLCFYELPAIGAIHG